MTNVQETRSKLLLIAFLIIVSCPAVFADSIWNKDSASPYTTEKNYKVGDIINIQITENMTAQNQAGTKSDIRDDLGLKISHSIARLAPILGTNTDFDASWSNKYKGIGSTTRASNVQGRIAAWVTDVLPNGNLAIMGKHKLQVNDEIQEITITGNVRAKDISGSNTIYSYQVANAEVDIKGTGVVADTESPGWVSRVINWLF
jgi:flagellar L-ring protein precursor FlgH